MTLVCSVVPNWNGAELLGACLDGLRAQQLPAGVEHRVVVVDNGSTDASRALLAARSAEVDTVLLPENQGFAGGVNRGIERARALGAEHVALLNNDAVADPGWLAALLAEAGSEPRAGVVAGKSLSPDGRTIDTAGDCYSVFGIAFPRGRGEPDDGQFDGPEHREVFAGTGGSSLFRMAMLDQVGDFAEDFFAYWEDVDLSFRARLAGWTVRYTPQARVLHAQGRTAERLGDFVRFHTFKNCLLLWVRCMPARLAVRYLPHLLFGLLWQLTSDASRGRLGTDLRALRAAAGLLPATLRARRRIQRSRAVSDAEVDRLLHHGWPTTMRSPRERLAALPRRLRR